ncbi:MAG: Rdx family protein [Ectothiorhodospiraceae bacterium AqS1]|nr:Rdx family protein [Ectothiorhodospiraceae bacterium AqS1]
MSERLSSSIEGAQVALIKSAGGVFEINLGDRLLFSKKATGRFPSEEELEAIVAEGVSR